MWLGMLLLGAYYTNFAYQIWVNTSAAGAFFGNFGLMLGLMILPPVMVFFFTGYLRPTRGKAKMTMLGPSVFLGLIYVILAYSVSSLPAMEFIVGNSLVFSSWGIGSAILTAGGFAIAQSYEQSTSPGMLDVSSLHYGPPKEEPEPEMESEPKAEVEAPTAEPKANSGDEKPEEPVSE
ncbi:hypothetical protein EU522_01855 [Candidatus Thorarchaeota archaeon]|nr:MAG: hypothetical protein EU522_01855 [Candidatus Thorarchaeota archaeon]